MNFLFVSKDNFTGKMPIFQNEWTVFAPDLFAFWQYKSNITRHVHVSSRIHFKAINKEQNLSTEKPFCAEAQTGLDGWKKANLPALPLTSG
jgi:hypothetical protein